MSGPWISNAQLWGCFGKDAFTTRDRAVAIIHRMARRRNLRRAGTMNAYLCPHCDRWHIGSINSETPRC